MGVEHAWPSAPAAPGAAPEPAGLTDMQIAPFRPGRVATEPSLSGRVHIVEKGRRYWAIRAEIAETDSEELAAKVTEMLSAAVVGTETWTGIPFTGPSFAAGGAVGGTKGGAIEVVSVFTARSGVVRITLGPSAFGETPDATHGALRREVRVGDFFTVGEDARLVQVSAAAKDAAGRPVVDFEEDRQLEVEIGDTVAAPATVRVQAAEDTATQFVESRFGPWEVDFREFIEDPLAVAMPRPLDRQYDLPDIAGIVGQTLRLDARRVWIDPDGGDVTTQVQASGGIEIVPAGENQYSLVLERAGRWEISVRGSTAAGMEDAQGFEVRAEPRLSNVGPVVTASVPTVAVLAGRRVSLRAANHIEDPDSGDVLTFTAAVDDPTVAAVEVRAGIVEVAGRRAGETAATLTGTDSSGRAISVRFGISVAALSLAPVGGVTSDIEALGALPAVSLPQRQPPDPGASYVLQSLYDWFRDRNREPLVFAASGAVNAAGQALVHPTLEGSKLTLTALVWTGSGMLEITATNPRRGYSLTRRLAVTVTAAANRAPVWNGPGDQVLGTAATDSAATAANPRSTRTITLTDRTDDAHCVDLDGDNLAFAVKSVVPAGVVTAAVAGNDLTLTRAAGATTRAAAVVTLTATDDGSPAMSSDHSFRVEARYPGDALATPGVTFNSAHSSLAARALTFPGQADTRDIGPALTPSANVRVTAESADRAVCTVSVNGTQLTITPAGAGRTTVTVSAARTTGNAAPGTHAITVVVAQAAGSPAAVWTGPAVNDVALVLGTPRTIDLDDHCGVSDGSLPTYSVFSTEVAKFTVTTSGARLNMVTLTPVAVSAAVPPQLRLAARTTGGITTNHQVSVPVTAAPVVPASTGLTTTAVPDFPAAGVTYYPGRTHDIDLGPYFTPGSAGFGVDWAAAEVQKTGSASWLSIVSFLNGVLRVRASGGSGAVAFRVRAAEQTTGAKTAWQSFTVTITPHPVAVKPTISGVGDRRVARGSTLDIDLPDFTTYTGSATVRYNFTIRTSDGGSAYPLQWVGTTNTLRVSSRMPIGAYRVTVYAWVEPYGRNTRDTDTFNLVVYG